MSVTDIQAVKPTTREMVLAGLREESTTWLFVVKTLLAFYITGWLAMRLELSQPSTAMITTVIVANRQTGLVLAKSFYRAIGTLAGAVAAFLIVGLFPQERVLFLGALSLWIGFCSGGAALYRNFKAYSFVLAGYTAAIIAIPVIDHPPDVFDSAVARISEVLLGLLVSGAISDTVLPSHMRDVLRKQSREQFAHFMQFVQRTTGGKIARGDIEHAHLRFVRDAIALEDLRSSVIFEDPEARARSGHLLLLNQCFMAASTSLQSLHHLIDRLQRNGRDVPASALIKLYAPLGVALDAPISAGTNARSLLPRLEAARKTMDAQAIVMRDSLVSGRDARDFDTGASLLHRFTEELYTYVDTAALLQAPGRIASSAEKVRFTHGRNYYEAGLAMVRTTLTMSALAIFWIISAWPYGASAMLLATIFAGLSASAPDPSKAVNVTFIGWALGMSAGFICEFSVLPQMDGFLLLVAGTAPFAMIGIVMMMWPALTAVGVGYGLGFTYILALKNQMVFDPVHFMNDMVAQFAGLSAAAVAFLLLPPTLGKPWFRRRQFEHLRDQVSVAAQAPLPGLANRFESVNHDLFAQIVAQTELGSKDSRELVAWALAVNETGRALIQLRSDMAVGHWPEEVKGAIAPAMDAFAKLYESPSQGAYLRTRDALDAAINEACKHADAAPLLNQLNLLRMTLLDELSALAEYMPSTSLESGVPHAT
jgi:uncharacterized membrane protein YccC